MCASSPRPSLSSRCRYESCAKAYRPIYSALGHRPCGLGQLARWPWVLHCTTLRFFPGGDWDRDDWDKPEFSLHGHGFYEWREEWTMAAARGVAIFDFHVCFTLEL